MTIDEQLRNTLVYETSATAAQIEADVERMKAFDKEYEKQESKWGCIAGIGVPVIIVGVLLFITNQGVLSMLGVGIAAVGVGMLIVGLVVRSSYGKFNLEDMRYNVLSDLVRLLNTDMRKEDPFNVRLSFVGHNHSSNFEREGKAGHWDAKYYRHAWLTLGGRLLDGAKFMIVITEKQQDRHRWKRSRSGKMKSKSKRKNGGEALVVLKFKTRRYPQFGGGEALQQALQLPNGAMVKSLNATGESLALQVKFGAGFISGNDQERAQQHVRLAATMLLSCYHVLNQSRGAKS